MNSFCRWIRSSLFQKFEIEVDVYVSKKKKLLHLSFLKPLVSYPFFEELIDFLKNYWQKIFLPRLPLHVLKDKPKFEMALRLCFFS